MLIDELAQAMPSFSNVLDDAWLGSSVVATSDDSLVVRNIISLEDYSMHEYFHQLY